MLQNKIAHQIYICKDRALEFVCGSLTILTVKCVTSFQDATSKMLYNVSPSQNTPPPPLLQPLSVFSLNFWLEPEL